MTMISDGVAWRARMNSSKLIVGIGWRARMNSLSGRMLNEGIADCDGANPEPLATRVVPASDELGRRVVLIVDVGNCDCSGADPESLATRVVPASDELGRREIPIVDVGNCDDANSEPLDTRVAPADDGRRVVPIADVGDDDDNNWRATATSSTSL